MRRDFTAGVLPYLAGGYAPVGGQPSQVSTWAAIIQQFENLIVTCVAGSSARENAWGAIGDIIVTLWPRGAPVDNLYSWALPGTSDRNDTSNVTYVEAYASGTVTLESTRVALAPGESSTLSFASVVGGGPTPTQSFSWGTGTGADIGVSMNGNTLPGGSSAGSGGKKSKRKEEKGRFAKRIPQRFRGKEGDDDDDDDGAG